VKSDHHWRAYESTDADNICRALRPVGGGSSVTRGAIEQLLEEWERKDSEIRRRQEAGQQADEIFERMAAKYGMMPDSAELIRQDRERSAQRFQSLSG
jgi:hypothetical protein